MSDSIVHDTQYDVTMVSGVKRPELSQTDFESPINQDQLMKTGRPRPVDGNAEPEPPSCVIIF